MPKTFVIQNVDKNITTKNYNNLLNDELLVHGAFLTTQGEGTMAGWLAFFIRLGGCNFGSKSVACNFCDTSFHFDDSHITKFESLLLTYRTAIEKIPRSKETPPIIVITGGEPLLQKNLIAFIKHVKSKEPNTIIQIETNGSQIGNVEKAILEGAKVIVSLKTVSEKYPRKPPSYSNRVDCFKFVVTANPEDPHHTVPDWIINWPIDTVRPPVYVSPMTVYKKAYSGEVSSIWDAELIDQVATAANYKYAAELAMKHNFRVSVQMHTFLGIA